jgi:hypothetical protein
MKNLTKKLLLLLAILSFTYSCSVDQDFSNQENNFDQEGQSLKKGDLINIDFCDDYSYFDLTNGHQMRSGVELSWTANLDGLWPPGLVNYSVQFQESYMVNGTLVYGNTFNFIETFSSTETNLSVTYSSGELNGSISGRWRIKAADCDWSAWKQHY